MALKMSAELEIQGTNGMEATYTTEGRYPNRHAAEVELSEWVREGFPPIVGKITKLTIMFEDN